ncbi:hemolysin family protein [Facklamia lactis]|uniref:hemolysin family protein n=1 Tax=Facklamia lactis TaxID=2749967 RepID=UPI0018CEE5C9|nr:hemolysin family protein [Facklamia lactis]MBG9980346.1 HlyC/CorC family transporter [Facklamia lactis]
MLTPILLLIIFTLLNGFFSGSEMAFISSDESKLQKAAHNGNSGAKLALQLFRNQDRVLAVVQVAITLIGTLNSSFATSGLSQFISPYLGEKGAGIAISLIVTLLTLVFGELLPKSIGQAIPEKYSKFSAVFLNIIYTIFKPVVWFLTKALAFFQSLLPIDFSNQDDKLTFTNIKEIVVKGGEDGALEREEVSMMQGVLKLNHSNVREIMVPRNRAEMIDITKEVEHNHEVIVNSIYSRIPVYQEDKDNILGVLLVKDYLRVVSMRDNYLDVDLIDLIIDPLNVPETLLLDDLFRKIQQTSSHLAIVKDEYGQTVGIATLEDIIEEIVGEIYDESDTVRHTNMVQQLDDQTWLVKGLMNLNDFNEYFKTLLNSYEVDTIGGYFTLMAEIVPSQSTIGKQLEINHYRLELLEVNEVTVKQLKVTKLTEDIEERDS